jgi:hypothetical protein
MSPRTEHRVGSIERLIAAAAVLAGSLALGSAAFAQQEVSSPNRLEDGTWEIDILSPIYTVDREYRSMTGPWNTRSIQLGDGADMLWVLGYRAVMAGPDGVTSAPQEYMCHSNLDFDPALHQQTFGGAKSITSRLFTLSQGQLEISFPEGFGMPLLANEPLSLTTQVLNLNPGLESVDVRHRVSIHFAKQSELTRPVLPLFTKGVYGLQLLEGQDGYFGVEAPQASVHGPGCLQGQNATTHTFDDGQGRKFTGHWVVKPGREINQTLVTKILELPYDTTIHYIAVHLHPFAESLELRDLTTGESVFKSSTRQFPDRIGLAHVDSYSSPQGIPIYKDHEYELVSVYQNITDRDQDSMAVMNLYMLDKDFVTPGAEPSSPAATASVPTPAGETVAPVGETVAPVGETVAPVGETVAPAGETVAPAAVESSSADGNGLGVAPLDAPPAESTP